MAIETINSLSEWLQIIIQSAHQLINQSSQPEKKYPQLKLSTLRFVHYHEDLGQIFFLQLHCILVALVGEISRLMEPKNHTEECSSHFLSAALSLVYLLMLL